MALSVFMTLETGNLVTLSGFLFVLFYAINLRQPEDKRIKIEAQFIMVFTILTLDTAYPLLKPRIDAIEYGTPYLGIVNDQMYAWRTLTFEVAPPALLPFLSIPFSPKQVRCVRSFFDYNTIKIQIPKDSYSSDLELEGGALWVCPKHVDYIKRLVKVNLLSSYPLDFKSYPKTASRFWWYTANDSTTRETYITLENDEDYPIEFNGNIQLVLTNETNLDPDHNLFKKLFSNPRMRNCTLTHFSFVDSIPKWNYASVVNATVVNDTIILTAEGVYKKLEPHSYANYYFLYPMEFCDKSVR